MVKDLCRLVEDQVVAYGLKYKKREKLDDDILCNGARELEKRHLGFLLGLLKQSEELLQKVYCFYCAVGVAGVMQFTFESWCALGTAFHFLPELFTKARFARIFHQTAKTFNAGTDTESIELEFDDFVRGMALVALRGFSQLHLDKAYPRPADKVGPFLPC
jgi:hypothetical protein